MIKNKICIALIFTSIALLISCMSSGELKNPPDWVVSTPEGNSKYEYFTASGTDSNPSEAEKRAIANLITEVTMYLGTSVKSNSTATISGDLDNIEKQLENTLSRKSSANLEDFRVSEKYFAKSGNKTVVYVLGQYKKSSINKEKQRLARLIIEKENSYLLPLQEGDKLFSNGYYLAATNKYIQSAIAAKTNNVDNANVHFQNAITKANLSIEKINITAQKKDNNSPPIFLIESDKNIKLKLAYTTKLAKTGKKRIVYDYITTTDQGYAEFQLPRNATNGFLYVDLDVANLLDDLESIGKECKSTKAKLEKLIAEKGLKLEYTNSNSPSKASKKQSMSIQISSNSEMQFELKNAITEELIIQGYKVVTSNAEFILTATLKTEKPELNENIYFTAFEIIMSVKKANGEVILSKNLRKRSTSFNESSAYTRIPRLASKIIIAEIDF